MTWMYSPRGGYGYTVPVNAEIVKVNRTTVRIRVQRVGGEIVERNVRPESLRSREARL
jgi:acyl-CoA hydrolase